MPADQSTKVVYRGTDNTEFFVIANAGMVNKYRSDKSTPLIDVVQSFDIFTTNTGGNTGEAMSPSKGLLESSFNTSNEDEIVKTIIEKGEEKGY
ncbi:ribosome maturation protein [Thamnidium elegans]|nr:ribosome maturation protein [Thamnidium elegans]